MEVLLLSTGGHIPSFAGVFTGLAAAAVGVSAAFLLLPRLPRTGAVPPVSVPPVGAAELACTGKETGIGDNPAAGARAARVRGRGR